MQMQGRGEKDVHRSSVRTYGHGHGHRELRNSGTVMLRCVVNEVWISSRYVTTEYSVQYLHI